LKTRRCGDRVMGLSHDSMGMNSELTKKALERVGNPHVLVNLVSRRVRQLNGGGGASRPLVDVPPTMGVADIALTEIIEEKIAWDIKDPEITV